MRAAWRLIVHGPVDGTLNMAIDRALQLCRAEGSAPPTLRLYAWSRPTVSAGRFQSLDDIDVSACTALGVDVVRRHTGGRGVLHDDELTYSLAASVDDGVPRTVTASYALFSRGLVEAYRLLGIPAQLVAHDRARSRSGACYLQSTRADLSAGDAKLSGSAQVWAGNAVLQHGSLVLTRDIGRERRVFMLNTEETSRLSDESTTVVDVLGTRPSREELASACVRGFEAGLGIALLPGELTAREAEVARALLAENEVPAM